VTCSPLDRVRGSLVLLGSKSEEPLELLLRCRALICVVGKEIEELVSSVLRRLGSDGCGGLVRVMSKEVLLESKLAVENVVAQINLSPCSTKSAVKRHSRIKG
jgi:hypothetical protein